MKYWLRAKETWKKCKNKIININFGLVILVTCTEITIIYQYSDRFDI